MINNRQAGRRRGRGGQRQGGNQGRGAESGNRIDNRARGNANQLLEKYKNLAADAQRQGDRVNTEYYLQFADHYFRVLADNRARFEEANPQARQQREDRDDDFDADDGDGFEQNDRRPDRGYDGQRDDRGREERQRDDRPRDDRQRDDRQRDDRPRADRRPRDSQPRDDQPRDERVREDRTRDDQHREDRLVAEDARPERAPRRRERAPRDGGADRIDAVADAQDDDRLSAAALPPAIQIGSEGEPARDDELPPPPPRRRGRPRRVDTATEAAAE